MSATSASTEVRDYLAAIKGALTDLAPAERDDLLEDLDDHLHEVLAEADGSLEQRLGPPAQYAAELRASAGLQPTTASTTGLVRGALEAVSTSALWQGITESRGTRATLQFLPQLRPAWWVVRAYLAVEFIAGFNGWLQNTADHGRYHAQAISLMPRVLGNSLLALVLIVVAIPISIQLGRHRMRGLGRGIVIAANALAIYMILPTLASSHGNTYYVQNESTPVGLFNNGRQISNIYPYDEQGRSLDNVRLYDDTGQPLTVLAPGQVSVMTSTGTEFTTPTATQPANVYPQVVPSISFGPDGTPKTVVVPRPAFVVPPLPSASASASPAPSASANITSTPTP